MLKLAVTIATPLSLHAFWILSWAGPLSGATYIMNSLGTFLAGRTAEWTCCESTSGHKDLLWVCMRVLNFPPRSDIII